MIRKSYVGALLLAGVLLGLVATGRISLHAQDRRETDRREPGPGARPESAPERGRDAVDPTDTARRATASPAIGSVQESLLRPFRFSFNRPTSLVEVCAHLKQTLGFAVVLDIAALGRQDVDPDDTVQLELHGVRLKTGLKLLLDQVGLTYHVVPEDNLLIITDREGSQDPLDRIWTELRTLHRDLHDVRDAVDEMTDILYGDPEQGARVRKPTIIEEKPERGPLDPEQPGSMRKKPADPGKMQGPAPAPRSTPTRVPLSNRHRAL